MKAVRYHEHGPPSVLVWEDAPDPPLGPGQILIRTKAVGVNFGETRNRAGLSPRFPLPQIPGLEVAGVVEAVGAGVSRFKPGDRVFGRALQTYAELVAGDAEDFFLLPDSLPFEVGAAAPVNFQTAWHGLVTVGGIQPGWTVYVVPAGGGVAFAGVQIAKARGCRVVAAAGGPAKTALVRALLAPDLTLDYLQDDVAARVAEVTGGQGCQLALDGNGAPTIRQTLRVLGVGGKVMVYGAPAGGTLDVPVRDLAYKRLAIQGFAVTDDLYPVTRAAFEREVIPRLADGRFIVHIAKRFPLSQAAAAHQALADRTVVGKVVLVAED
ncbi:MAG: NADPH:quinone reductase [Chloroflexota bacterium]|nr:NADPH:quinone reductase [Dehalococcoidia bacterium]MDW8254261.1 NADPH:quinone reductase [Chloroflexota bacterium]